MDNKDLKQSLINTFSERFPEESAGILNAAPIEEILAYLKSQQVVVARQIFVKLSPDVSRHLISEISDEFFIELFSGLNPYDAAIILSRQEKPNVEAKLKLLPLKQSKEIKEIMSYPADSAGFLMDTKIIAFYPEDTVKDVLKKLRILKDRKLLLIYVIDSDGNLIGKIPIQVIAISMPQEQLKNLVEECQAVHVLSLREEIVEIFKSSNLINLPVLDFDKKLLGIIRHDALIEATRQNASENVQVMFGAGREERALSKVGFAVKKRLPWLEINLATAFLAAAVVGIFEETIAQITVLAVFLPVVAGQSGNTGSQALAVTMRGLALREIRPSQWLRVARKEAAVGFVNGFVVALTTSIIVFFWASSIGLAMIIAVSMVFSMIIAGFSGAVIPIFLKSIGQDPAQSSSIVLTTVTDIVGFLSFLGLATALGSMLGVI